MKIGVISDIHNNLIALEEVLKVLKDKGCTEIICCGDIIGIGPYPEETVRKLMATSNIKCVLGNHEKYLIHGLKNTYPEGMSHGEAEHHLWEHGMLSSSSKKFIEGLPQELELVRDGVKIMVMHYSMNNEGEYVNYTQNPTGDDCDRMFHEYDADVILYGHDHQTSVVKGRDSMYINCGSMGCPHDSKDKRARAGILTITDGVMEFEHILVEYDLQKVIRKIDSIKYPEYELIKGIFFGVE